MYLSIYLSIYLYICICIYIYIYSPRRGAGRRHCRPRTFLSIYLSIYLSVCMYACMYVYICIHVCINVSIYLSIYLSISMYMYIYRVNPIKMSLFYLGEVLADAIARPKHPLPPQPLALHTYDSKRGRICVRGFIQIFISLSIIIYPSIEHPFAPQPLALHT